MTIRGKAFPETSVILSRICLCALVIIVGLALRRYGFGIGLPATIVKYGGSILWAAMLFFVVAIAAPQISRRSVVLVSSLSAIGIELFRLVHTPWFDEFRLTLPGALLLGRIFSLRDILAYGFGIGLALGLDGLAERVLAKQPRPYSAS
jgi:hypothetical protein